MSPIFEKKLMEHISKNQNRLKISVAKFFLGLKALTKEMGGGADVNPNILRRMLSKYAENLHDQQKFSQMNDQDCLDVHQELG